MKQVAPFSFNKEVAKAMGKEQFLRIHKPLFPHINLDKAWDKVFPPQVKPAKDK